MTEPGLSRPAPCWLLCCLLAGCAARLESYVEKTRASVLVVRGYLESGELHRWKVLDRQPGDLFAFEYPAADAAAVAS